MDQQQEGSIGSTGTNDWFIHRLAWKFITLTERSYRFIVLKRANQNDVENSDTADAKETLAINTFFPRSVSSFILCCIQLDT